MSRVLKQPAVQVLPEIEIKAASLASYLPAALALGGGVALSVLRFYAGGGHFISDGALMMLALACYLVAAISPRAITVRGKFSVRGGITTTVTVSHAA